MATLSERKTEIKNNGYIILDQNEKEPVSNVRAVIIDAIKVVDSNVATRRQFRFWEDTDTRDYYYQESYPFKESNTQSFKQELEDFVKTVQNEGVILSGFIENHNAQQKTGIIKTIMPDYTSHRYFLYKDVSGNFQYKEMKG